MQVRSLLLRDILLLRTSRALIAEFLGTAVLVAAVIGSGIMAQSLTSDKALQLLINALSTILALGTLIWLFADLSGAHFNPIVSIAMAIRKDLPLLQMGGFVVSQSVGGLAGTALANAMFDRHLFEASKHYQSGHALLLGEVVATCGLVLLILAKFPLAARCICWCRHGSVPPISLPLLHHLPIPLSPLLVRGATHLLESLPRQPYRLSVLNLWEAL